MCSIDSYISHSIELVTLSVLWRRVPLCSIDSYISHSIELVTLFEWFVTYEELARLLHRGTFIHAEANDSYNTCDETI